MRKRKLIYLYITFLFILLFITIFNFYKNITYSKISVSDIISIDNNFTTEQKQEIDKVIDIINIVNKEYIKTVNKYNYIYLFINISILSLFSFIIYIYINKRENSIVNDINTVLDTNSKNIDVEVLKKSINEKIEDFTVDYKRLNSYVAHEQKNELSILRAKIELNEDKELLKEVDNITNRLDDILILTSVNNCTLEEVDVLLICASLIDQYKAVYKDIELIYNENVLYNITARELFIKRAISNLIINAIKHGSGNIVIDINNINETVIIKVINDGNILDENKLDEIIDYKYKISELNKNGYGIGLSLIKHVCDICRGDYFIENDIINKKTIFYLVFKEKD